MNENKQKMIGNIIVALILSAAIIFSCFLGVYGLAEYKSKRNDIDIKGWATQQIVSDMIIWSGSYSIEAQDLQTGYGLLEADKVKVKDYFLAKGFKEEDLIFSAISINEQYVDFVKDEFGNTESRFDHYNLSQTMTITSDKIDLVTEVSRESSELINAGVEFQSFAPEYHYTKLDELKVSMLADATKDATNRAQLIAENAGSKLGKLAHAHLSKIKITPLYDVPEDYYDDYYDYGNYVDKDTVSLEKEVTVIVYCTFEIE